VDAKTGEPRRRALQMRHFFFCFVLAQLGLPSLAGEGGRARRIQAGWKGTTYGTDDGIEGLLFRSILCWPADVLVYNKTCVCYLIKPSLFQVSCLMRRADNWQRGIFTKYRRDSQITPRQTDCLSHRLVIATKLEDAGWAVGAVARHLSAPAPAPCLHLSFMID
jgi:hypothetical protein